MVEIKFTSFFFCLVRFAIVSGDVGLEHLYMPVVARCSACRRVLIENRRGGVARDLTGEIISTRCMPFTHS